ncbi:MAG TPA: amidohydrolase family protein [Bryobacteraceae bacterium]|nr:amidohydrolase family protein [Bryobacteraceae bacterium]
MLNRRTFLAATVATGLNAAGKAPLIIDSHVHVWKHDQRFPFAKEARPPAEDASAGMLLDLMKANGVARTVIIQVIHYRWDNSYLADVLKRYPGQFKGVCRVNPEDPAAPDHLSRLTEEQGFHGVRLSPAAGAAGDWIRGPLMPPLWKRCAQLRVPMTVLAPVTRMPDIAPLIEQNPDLTVVIDHQADSPLNQPEKLEMLLSLQRYPKVFVKISHMWSLSKEPYPYPDAQLQVRRLYDRFGAKRLMWGTDWPISLKQLPYAKAVELFRDHMDFFTPEDRQWILGKTVQQVWPFGL